VYSGIHFIALYAECSFYRQYIYQQKNHILVYKTLVSTRHKSQVKSSLFELAYFTITSPRVFLWGSFDHDLPFAFPDVLPCVLPQLPNLFPGLIPGWTPPNPLARLSGQTTRCDHLSSSFPSNSHFLFFPIRWGKKQGAAEGQHKPSYSSRTGGC